MKDIVLNIFVIAQILGFISLVLDIAVTQVDSNKKVLVINCVSNCLYSLQYYLLGSIPGAIISFIAAARNVIFAKFKKDGIPLALLLIYYFIVFAFTYVFWDHKLISLIPTLNVFLFSYGLYKKDVYLTKKIYVVTATLGIIYNFLIMAYVSTLTEILCLIGAIVGVIRYQKEMKKKKPRRGKRLPK